MLIYITPSSIRITKAKRHATYEMVEQGKTAFADMQGNTQSDIYVKKGSRTIGDGVHELAHFYADREESYIQLAASINRTILNVMEKKE